jgi:hypothetical protein
MLGVVADFPAVFFKRILVHDRENKKVSQFTETL